MPKTIAAATRKGSYNRDAIAIAMDPDHDSVPLSNRLRQIRNGQLVLVK